MRLDPDGPLINRTFRTPLLASAVDVTIGGFSVCSEESWTLCRIGATHMFCSLWQEYNALPRSNARHTHMEGNGTLYGPPRHYTPGSPMRLLRPHLGGNHGSSCLPEGLNLCLM